MEFRTLGEVQLLASGHEVPLGPLKQRTLLAAFLLDAGRSVPTDTLIDRVWSDAPPTESRNVLYTYVTRLRRILISAGVPAPALRRQAGGYLLDIDPGQVDLHLLRRCAAEARRFPVDDSRRLSPLRQAVELWRGEPLAGLPGQWVTRVQEGLRQQLLGVLSEWADAELRFGSPGDVTDRLSRVLDDYPLAEMLVAHLMRALYVDGRRAEALEQYARTRKHIVDELGVEPAIELQELHREMLCGTLAGPRSAKPDPSATGGPSDPEPVPPDGMITVPVDVSVAAEPTGPAEPAGVGFGCQLPGDLHDFTGFREEIARVLALLGGSAAGSRSAAGAGAAVDAGAGSRGSRVVVVSGPGGIGKTSLSVHIAHLLRAEYPDGQVFVGCNDRDQKAELLGRVLRAFGLPDVARLRSVEDRIVRYRSAISGKRVLIVLDNVASAEEVRQLVPGASGCALLVSSRARLTTLAAAEHIELREFSSLESMTLLRRIVGEERVSAEPTATADVVATCAGLPLALRIVGARLVARPHWRMSRLLNRMRDERRRLDEMSVDGLAVRVSVAVSYDAVAPAARRAFRLLGFLGAPVFAEWLVAAVVDGSVEHAEELLEQLFDARLVDVVDDPVRQLVRYRMHELVRLYAYEQALEEDAPEVLRAGVERALVATTELVERLCEPLPYAIPRLYRRISAPTALHPSVGDVDCHQPGWLSAEADAMVVTVERAAALGMDDGACALADALVFAAFARHNNFDGWNRAHAAARTAARAADNRAAEAIMECGIGFLRYKEDRFVDAERHFTAAIALFDATHHEHGRAAASSGLGTVLREVGRHREAVPLLERALSALERLGDRDGAAHAAYGLGYAHREVGNDESALRYLHRAGNLYRSTGHWRGEAIAVRGIGLVHRAREELESAEQWFVRAHDMVAGRGDPLLACYTIQSLAKLWIRQGEPERAREPLNRSLQVCLEAHDRLGAALIRRTLGEMSLAAGRADQALDDLNLALATWTELDHDLGRARTLRDIGAAHAVEGDCAAAHQAWRAAYDTFASLDTREARELAEWVRRWGCHCELAWLRQPADGQPQAGSVL